MTYVFAILAGVVGAVVGWFVAGYFSGLIAGAAGMSDFEGGRGMFSFLVVGPIGGLIGLVAGVWLVLRFHGGVVDVGAVAAHGGLVVLGIVALVAAGIGIRYLTLDTFSGEQGQPTMLFEIRVPATFELPAKERIDIELHTDRNQTNAFLHTEWLRRDGSHQVISGGVPLYFKRSRRLLVLKVADQPVRLFDVRLSASPRSSREFGTWHRTDHIDAPGSSQPSRAPKDDPFEIRYRVYRAGEE